MPRFTFTCPEHGEFQVSLKSRQKTMACPKCNVESKNVFKQGTVQTLERLDNGLMFRRVDRLSNIEEIMDERYQKFSKKEDENDDENS